MDSKKFDPNRLKDCRDKAGLSVDGLMIELSKIGLTVHTNTLANWEKGNSSPDVNDLAIIASFYKKPIQYFFVF